VADLPKIGHISSKLNTFPQKWGHLHRVEIIDLPQGVGEMGVSTFGQKCSKWKPHITGQTFFQKWKKVHRAANPSMDLRIGHRFIYEPS